VTCARVGGLPAATLRELLPARRLRRVRLERTGTLGRELTGDLQLVLQRRARLGELFDVALDAIEAFLFGNVAFARHSAREYHLTGGALSLEQFAKADTTHIWPSWLEHL
jgi:hypothetical protein